MSQAFRDLALFGGKGIDIVFFDNVCDAGISMLFCFLLKLSAQNCRQYPVSHVLRKYPSIYFPLSGLGHSWARKDALPFGFVCRRGLFVA